MCKARKPAPDPGRVGEEPPSPERPPKTTPFEEFSKIDAHEIIYTRISTDKQNHDSQLQELRNYCNRVAGLTLRKSATRSQAREVAARDWTV